MDDMLYKIRAQLIDAGWFQEKGAYFLVDGQYGSTGKGLVAGLLAEAFGDAVDWSVTNAGPNSGHTSYYGDEQIVLKQLPTYPVVAWKANKRVNTFLNAGAIIDMDILRQELDTHQMDIFLHPYAAKIDGASVDADKSTIENIGSTGKGIGPALARKVGRSNDAVVGYTLPGMSNVYSAKNDLIDYDKNIAFVEVAQGYSLGINSGFYPYTTSRECTVMQAMNDAAIHPKHYRQSIMVVRTYPIRVAGNSGPCYPDQEELSWDDLGVKPELTTVTQKVRRVFTWSCLQFKNAVAANRPEHVCLNFVNYLNLNNVNVEEFVRYNVLKPYCDVMGTLPETLLLGFGPRASDTVCWDFD